MSPSQILDGVWRFEALHPEWTEDEGGEEGWEPAVAWWAIATAEGLALVDPLVSDWEALDELVVAHGGCPGIVRTCHWHERSIAEAARRYRAPVLAGRPVQDSTAPAPEREVRDRELLFGALIALHLGRIDELCLWLSDRDALLFGDAMLRRESGRLRVCPDSWLPSGGGQERLREILAGLAAELPVAHVLVSHGPHVAGDGLVALRAALA